MGSGRTQYGLPNHFVVCSLTMTRDQGQGGFGVGGDNDEGSRGGNKKDSTAGKIQEKLGSIFKSDKMEQKGREKRGEAGGYDENTNY